MRLTIEQEILSSNLSLVSRAIAARPSNPILSNILFEASEDRQQLSLTAFDMSFGIHTRFEAPHQNHSASYCRFDPFLNHPEYRSSNQADSSAP